MHALGQILFMSLPLSANRILVNILQSMEAVMLPGQLRIYGYSNTEALSGIDDISVFLFFLCFCDDGKQHYRDRVGQYRGKQHHRKRHSGTLLEIIAFTIPFGAIHSCINGYFYGLKKTFVPAVSQLLEQFARVLSVWLFFQISMEKHNAISLNLVVWGMVVGEFAAVLFSVSFLRHKKSQGSRVHALGQILFKRNPRRRL